MLNLFKTLLISSFLISSMGTVYASDALTTVEFPLSAEGEQQITPILSQGLSTVLTRLTGDTDIAKQKAAAEIINDPNSFLENYSQQTNPDRLMMSFDQQSIEKALNKTNIAYWDKRRPSIMIWWLNENSNGIQLTGDSQPSTKIITSAAQTQGFPVIFPMADLNEQALANKENFTASPPTALLKSSQQYMPNATLVVYMQQKENNYQAQWQLWLNNNDTKPLASAEVKGASEQQIADQIFLDTNTALAKVFIIKNNSEAETINITIHGLDFARYVEINNLMNSFDGKVIETTGSTAKYQVKANPAQIKAQLALLHFSEKQEESTTATSENKIPTLIFQASSQ